MRTLLGMGFVLALACGAAAADEKIDAKKLVGKWERVVNKDAKVKAKFVVEYTADGKIIATIGENKIEGTYKVDGNKMILTMNVKGKEAPRTVTVKKLTDEVMENESDKGEKASYKKLKDEKKDK